MALFTPGVTRYAFSGRDKEVGLDFFCSAPASMNPIPKDHLRRPLRIDFEFFLQMPKFLFVLSWLRDSCATRVKISREKAGEACKGESRSCGQKSRKVDRVTD